MHSYKSSKVDTSETNIFSNVSQCPSQLDFVTLYYFLLSVYTVVCVVTSNLDRDPIITFQAPSPESTCASTSRDSTNTSQSRYFRSMMSFNTNKCSKSGTRRKCCRCTALKNIFFSIKNIFLHDCFAENQAPIPDQPLRRVEGQPQPLLPLPLPLRRRAVHLHADVRQVRVLLRAHQCPQH